MNIKWKMQDKNINDLYQFLFRNNLHAPWTDGDVVEEITDYSDSAVMITSAVLQLTMPALVAGHGQLISSNELNLDYWLTFDTTLTFKL